MLHRPSGRPLIPGVSQAGMRVLCAFPGLLGRPPMSCRRLQPPLVVSMPPWMLTDKNLTRPSNRFNQEMGPDDTRLQALDRNNAGPLHTPGVPGRRSVALGGCFSQGRCRFLPSTPLLARGTSPDTNLRAITRGRPMRAPPCGSDHIGGSSLSVQINALRMGSAAAGSAAPAFDDQ